MQISIGNVVGFVLPLCALGIGFQQKFLTPHFDTDSMADTLDQSHVWSSFAGHTRDIVVGVELVVFVAVYAFVGVNTASYVSDAFGCSWSFAMVINTAIWPVTVTAAFFALAIQHMKALMVKRNLPPSATDNAKLDNLLSLVHHGTPQFCVARLTEKLGGMETVTPEILVDRLQIPRAKAIRWHKWLARGNPELSLNMLLCRAAELHKAEGKKICRILFEIYDENDDGVLSRSEAKEVLQNWCIGKYGATVLKDDGMLQFIDSLMGQVSFSEGDINKTEWMRLADNFPELFETESQSPEDVRNKVRMDQKPHVHRLTAS